MGLAITAVVHRARSWKDSQGFRNIPQCKIRALLLSGFTNGSECLAGGHRREHFLPSVLALILHDRARHDPRHRFWRGGIKIGCLCSTPVQPRPPSPNVRSAINPLKLEL
eukprot:3422405-Rhodomonas_salina.1